MLKYKILENEYKVINGKKLFSIVALRDIIRKTDSLETIVARRGDFGGYIECEKNLSHEGSCWIYDSSIVEGKSIIENDAIVKEHSSVKGCSIIKDNAKVISSEIDCNALISGNAIIKSSFISDQAHIRDSFIRNCNIIGNTKVVGNIELESCIVKELAKIKTICSQPQNVLPHLKDCTFRGYGSTYVFCVPDVDFPTIDRTIAIYLNANEDHVGSIHIGTKINYSFSPKELWDGLMVPLHDFLLSILPMEEDLTYKSSIMFLEAVTDSSKMLQDTICGLVRGLVFNISKLESTDGIIDPRHLYKTKASKLECILYAYSVILTNLLIITRNLSKTNLKVANLFFKGLVDGADMNLQTREIVSFEECFLYSKVLVNYLISDLYEPKKIKSDLRNKFSAEPIY